MSRRTAPALWINTVGGGDRPSGGGEKRRRGARSLEGSGPPGHPGVTSLTVTAGGGRVACEPARRAVPVRVRTWTAAGGRFVAWWVTPGSARRLPGRSVRGTAGRRVGVTERDLAGPGTTGRGAGAMAGAAVAGRTSAIDRVSVETERVVA
ncbi:hypothetical protein JCM9534A_76200 [Catenuloplanes indicus JCM 9534]